MQGTNRKVRIEIDPASAAALYDEGNDIIVELTFCCGASEVEIPPGPQTLEAAPGQPIGVWLGRNDREAGGSSPFDIDFQVAEDIGESSDVVTVSVSQGQGDGCDIYLNGAPFCRVIDGEGGRNRTPPQPPPAVVALDTSPLVVARNLCGVETLAVRACWSVELLRQISGLSSLRHLHLSGSGEGQMFGELSKLTQLERFELELSMSSLRDTEALRALSRVTSLDFAWSLHLTDLGGLSALSRLSSLNLHSCNSLSMLAGLETLTGLKDLYLTSCGSLRDISALSGLTGLRRLNLAGCSSLESVDALAPLVDLEWLNLWDCARLASVAPIAHHPKLDRRLFPEHLR